MIKKSSAIAACAIVCVFTFLISAALTAGGGILYFTGTGQLQLKSAPAPTSAVQQGDYSRLDEIRNVYHTQALVDVPDQTLLDGAAHGMAVESGDKYSELFTPEEFKQFQDQENGNYVGIGVSVNLDPKDNLITAITVYKGSPAEQAGMKGGDKIIKVGDTDVTAMSLDQTVKLVRGEAGSKVTITVLRGEDQVVLTITRASVTMDFTDPPKLLGNGIGYIRILEFNGNAATLFDKYVKQLQAQGMKGLILDLRNNPGGSLNIVAPIADELFPKGPIITMQDRSGKAVEEIDSNANHLGLPMVVLVNENSASASELLSGGIQDYKVGTLIGVKTYGKGVAQSFATLSDGSVLKYTADKYLTGGGRCPQGVGITPDIVVELAQAVKDNPMLLCTDQDNQYQKAIEEITKMIK